MRVMPAVVALMFASLGCRSREAPVADTAAPMPAPVPSDVAAPVSRGLPIIVVKPETATFPLGAADFARFGPRGWMSTKSDPSKKASLDLVLSAAKDAGAPGVIRAPRLGSPAFISTRTKTFASYEDEQDLGGQLFSLDDAHADLVVGASSGEWAFDLEDRRTLLVGTRGGKMMIASHWQISVLGPDGSRVASSAEKNESAWGAGALGDGFVVAVREPIAMAGATLGQKVSAMQGVLGGNGEAAAQLAEPAQGSLLFVDKEGRVKTREAIGPRRPQGLATTEHGWLVVLGEGTMRNAFRDAVMIARAPGESNVRLLASDLDTVSGLRSRGSWSCLTELPSKDNGETYVVHCFDPERGLHLATPPIEGIVSILDIDNASRVWISQHRYHGEPRDEVLTMPLRKPAWQAAAQQPAKLQYFTRVSCIVYEGWPYRPGGSEAHSYEMRSITFTNSVAVSARLFGTLAPRRETSFIAPRSWFAGPKFE